MSGGAGLGMMSSPKGARQVLTFRVGTETYAVDILRVLEIRGWSSVTRIPNSAAHVLGVLDVRGAIVPIVDLRTRFGMTATVVTPLTVVIVLSTSESVRGQYGLMVDSVADVVDVDAAQLKHMPELGGAPAARFIQNLAAVAGRTLNLLDLDALSIAGVA